MGSANGESESPARESVEEFAVRSNESVSAVVALAVAATKRCSFDELRPLHRAVEADALDAMFQHSSHDVTVEFEYEGCRVETDGDRVRVVPLDGSVAQ